MRQTEPGSAQPVVARRRPLPALRPVLADTDGDGYGDLRGIISRLDHLEWLGVDGIWLSPDHALARRRLGLRRQRLHRPSTPSCGTLADLDELIAAAGARGLRVLLDLVPNHTSSAAPVVHRRRVRPRRRRTATTTCGPTRRPAAGRRTTGWTPPAAAPGRSTPADRPVLPAQLPAHPARPELVGAGRARGVPRGSWSSGSTAAWPGSASTWRTACTRTRSCATTRRWSRRTGATRWSASSGSGRSTTSTSRGARRLPGLAEDRRAATPRTGCCSARPGSATRTQLAAFYGDDDELQLAFNFPFVFAGFTAAELAGVVRRTLATIPAGSLPGVDGLQPRRRPVPEPLVRRRRPADPAGAAAAGHAARHRRAVLRRRDRHARRRRCRPSSQRDEMTLGAPTGRADRDRARTPMQWDELAARPGSPRPPGPGCRSATPPPATWPPSAPTPARRCACAATCWPCAAPSWAARSRPTEELAVAAACGPTGWADLTVAGQPVRPGPHAGRGRPARSCSRTGGDWRDGGGSRDWRRTA